MENSYNLRAFRGIEKIDSGTPPTMCGDIEGLHSDSLDAILIPDPVTGLPTNPLRILQSVDVRPEVKDYVRTHLIGFGFVHSEHSDTDIDLDNLPPSDTSVFSRSSYLEKQKDILRQFIENNKTS